MSGEYISREAVLKFRLTASLRPEKLTVAQAVADAIAEYIQAIPAADVKPVIHAHFYVDEGCAYCSNCRNNFEKAILKAVKFCPMCGAQIDGYGAHPDAGPPPPYDLLREEGGVDV